MPNKHLYPSPPHFLKCFFILVFLHNSQMVPSLNSKHQEVADTFLIRTPVTGWMTHPIPVWPHLNYILRCCLHIRSHSQVPGSRASTCLSGGLGSPHNRHVWNWDYQPQKAAAQVTHAWLVHVERGARWRKATTSAAQWLCHLVSQVPCLSQGTWEAKWHSHWVVSFESGGVSPS